MKGYKVSDDLAWAIIRMAPILRLQDIEAYTAISQRQIRRILACWQETVEVKALEHRNGRPKQLTVEDIEVCPLADLLDLLEDSCIVVHSRCFR